MWTLALESQNEEVYKDAISFLVNCYLEVAEDLKDQKSVFANTISQKCLEIIQSEGADSFTVKRCIQILKNVV